ncbi:MAG: D-2-hydroxyacid dehydrogenase [Flavobacteriales bacterium]|jgi:D-3-phosphoglycerate dehydrogenase|nr:D-2-hydroxyacid dehydrogenase [Flavobacteriales bacterium]
MRIHANDGIAESARKALEAEGFKTTTDSVPQERLAAHINAEQVDVLLVRSATKVRQELIDACPGLKLIGRGGVGVDNIDVAYARGKGIEVINTPAASSISVAELVMAHLFGLMRELHRSNRAMPTEGAVRFKELKKACGKGGELRGRTLGVIGFGRIGQWTARYALGAGMRVVYTDGYVDVDALDMEVGGTTLRVPVEKTGLDELLGRADAISLHVPSQADGRPVLGADELARTKAGVVIVNTARGGSVDEDALLAALAGGQVKAAALDVFTNEPVPRTDLLTHPALSLSPHIGAATAEAQERIGQELVERIVAWRATIPAGE